MENNNSTVKEKQITAKIENPVIEKFQKTNETSSNKTGEEEKKPEEKKVENILYTNPLLQTLTTQDLTKEKFSHFKKNIDFCLLQLIGQLTAVKIQMTPLFLDEADKVEEYLQWAEDQCKKLETYCRLLGEQKSLPMSYRYIGEKIHQIKTYPGIIKQFIRLYKEKNKSTTYKKIEWIIKSIISDIQEEKNEIATIKYSDEIIYIPKKFFPTQDIQEEITRQIANIQIKNISIHNMIWSEYHIHSYQEIFRILINNLLSNAEKFTPIKWEITVWIEKEDERQTTFFVKNTWPQIQKNIDVFAGWYTTSSQEWKKWTWLWLVQCKEFLNNINGTIYQKSNNKWTTFFFTLPKTPQ